MPLNLQGFFKPSLIPNSKSKIPNPYIIDSYELLFKDCCLNILNGKNNLLGRYITDRGMIYLVPLMTTTRGQPATCKWSYFWGNKVIETPLTLKLIHYSIYSESAKKIEVAF